MAKVLLRLFAILIAIAVVIAIIGSVLPRDYDFQTSRQIDADPGVVFSMINELPKWQQWSNWNPERVADLKIEYGDTKSGEGAVQSWTDPRGSGKLWITRSLENKVIEYQLKFSGFPEMANVIELEPNNSGTLVTWSSKGRLPQGPFYGYFASLFPTRMKFQYEHNLGKLAEILE